MFARGFDVFHDRGGIGDDHDSGESCVWFIDPTV
jgi:hypothetical protein